MAQSDFSPRALRSYHSLRLRLPLLIGSLILVVLGAFLWTFERQLERTLLRTGSERALVAAGQIANMLNQSATRGAAEIHRVAGDDAVRAYLVKPTDQTRPIVEQRLKPLAVAGQPPVELLDATGADVLLVEPPAGATSQPAPSPAEPAASPARGGPPSRLGIGAFRLVDGVVVFEVAEEIRASSPDGGSAPGQRLGFLVVRRTMRAAQNSDAVGRLVGAGATVAIGNRSGDVWTNLSAPVKAPPITPDRAGVAEYKAVDGSWRIGGLALIDGTPWNVWVEFPRDVVVAAARTSLRQLSLLSAGLVILAAFGVAVLSARITKPLYELTQASEAIAAGDYARRFVTTRRDEIGRLGAAFNAMTEQVEHARNDLQQELSQFFALSVDLLCIAGMDGRIKRVNEAWHRTLGWTAEELTGRPYLDFIHPDDRASTSAEADRQAAGQLAISFENRYRCKDGSYRWLSWNAAPLPSRGLIFAAARDVTDEKRTAKELERRAQELTVVNHELEAFSYSVSHDLRAPLRHIHGYVEMLQRSTNGHLSEQAQRYLKTITDASVEMGQLIDDLLAFSRMGRTEMQAARVPLDELVKETIGNLEMATKDRRIVWQAPPLPPVVGDPSLLKQVLANVIGNALKYSRMRDPARIEIGCAGEEDGRVILFVRDNGAGFDMQYAHKLFGVFQRLHRPEEFEGTGIGLATVRRIVTRHGGRVWAEGALNEGATFYFTLKPALSA